MITIHRSLFRFMQNPRSAACQVTMRSSIRSRSISMAGWSFEPRGEGHKTKACESRIVAAVLTSLKQLPKVAG